MGIFDGWEAFGRTSVLRPLSPLPISPPLCHKEGVNLIMLFLRNHRGRAIYFYHAGRDKTPENRKNVV
jgi:hypothetical protein